MIKANTSGESEAYRQSNKWVPLFQGYPVIFKSKSHTSVPRVFEKNTRSWREFDELSEKEKKRLICF